MGDENGRSVAYLIFGGLAVLFCAIVVVAIASLTGGDERANVAAERRAQLQKLPVYWKVKRGDTYVRIAQKTGLTVDELETFNP